MNPIRAGLKRGSALLLGLLFVLAAAHASDAADAPGTSSGRAVRLSSVEGEVSLTQADQTLTDHALANTPLFEGTQITTADEGRAEIQFEDGSVARIAPDSSLTLSVLSPSGQTEMLLGNGLAYFELQADEQNRIKVRFGPDTVSASGFSVLRVKLDDGPANVAVFSGNAHLEGSGGISLDLHGGESVAVDAANPSASQVAESIEPDSWDAWNSDRDQALDAADANQPQHTHDLPQSNNPAWGDLSSNGTWYNTPDQGMVWSPYEASNPSWDPYGTGSWMYQPGYGYVWISGESWGYMPYQCGAWNYYDAFGWGWAPGACNSWWTLGTPGWFYTIGNSPRWYHPPVRPRAPIPVHGRPLPHTGPVPVISVVRRSPAPVTALPPRDIAKPVLLGGNMARPVAPHPMRPVYNHQAPPDRQTFLRPSGTAPAFPTGPANGSMPAQPGNFVGNPSVPRVVIPPVQRPMNTIPTRPVFIPAPRSPAPPVRSAPPPAVHSAPAAHPAGSAHPR